MNKKSKKVKVIELLNSIENMDIKPMSYINPNKYIQHNLSGKDGVEGFNEILIHLRKGNYKIAEIKAFEDGNYVFTHKKFNFFEPKIGFDIFRFEKDLIVEHWDNIQDVSKKGVFNTPKFAGTSIIRYKEKTKENKEFIKSFVKAILLKNSIDKLANYISTKNELKNLKYLIGNITKSNLKYTKNHKILGEGNFVLSISEGEFLKKQISLYDLFIISNGKIEGYWNTTEEIPNKKEWKNNNGKFNF